jgi:hypothetical protein
LKLKRPKQARYLNIWQPAANAHPIKKAVD